MGEFLQKDFMSYLHKNIGTYKGMFCGLTILNFILGVMSLFHTYALSFFIDHVNTNTTMKYVYMFVLVYSGLMLLKVVLGYVLNYMISRYNLKIANKVALQTLQYIQNASILQVKNMNSVYLSERINSDSNVLANFLVTAIEGLCMNVVVSAIVLLIIFVLSAKIGVILLFGYVAYAVIYIVFMKVIYRKMKCFREATSNYLQGVNEQIAFIEHIQINNKYSSFINRLLKKFDFLYKNGMSYQISSNLVSSIESVLFVAMSAIILMIGGNDIIHGTMTLGEFTMVFCYATAMLGYLSNIINFFQGYQVTKTSYDRLKELDHIKVLEDGSLVCQDVSEISLQDVSFCYDDKVGIKDITYDFKKGFRYLIHGENGSGKSTLINVIIKLFEHHTGNIFMNQVPIDDYDMRKVRGNCIGIMIQESAFPESTIMDYINDSSNTNYTMKEIAKLLSRKGLDDFAIDFIDLVNQNVPDMNSLSGGEKQKIDIIRVIVKDAPVMIFDEPTAHLDVASCEQFYNYLNEVRKDKIIMVISHSENIEKHFDFTLDMASYTYKP